MMVMNHLLLVLVLLIILPLKYYAKNIHKNVIYGQQESFYS